MFGETTGCVRGISFRNPIVKLAPPQRIIQAGISKNIAKANASNGVDYGSKVLVPSEPSEHLHRRPLEMFLLTH